MAAAFELYEELSQKNAQFRKVYDAWTKFRADEHLWFRVAERSFDSFVLAEASRERRAPAAKATSKK